MRLTHRSLKKTTGRMTALCFLHSMAYVISYHAQFLQMLTGNRRELSRATWRSYVTVILVSKWGLFLTSSVFLFQRRYRIKLHKVYVFPLDLLLIPTVLCLNVTFLFRIRVICYKIATNKYFVNFVLILIIVSSILLAAEDPLNASAKRNQVEPL